MIAGGLAVLIVIAAIVAVLLFNINSYKSRIETATSEATGLDVRINGKMGLSFFPFGVSAKDIHVANKGSKILSLESLKIGVGLMSLLKKLQKWPKASEEGRPSHAMSVLSCLKVRRVEHEYGRLASTENTGFHL